MKKKLVIIGAGGHGRVCAEIASMNGYSDISFLDDKCGSLVIGSTKDIIKYVNIADMFVAILDNSFPSSLDLFIEEILRNFL